MNQRQVNENSIMEIAILDEHHDHVPRIMTFRNGVREDTARLDRFMNDPPVLWNLVVDDPATTGITRRGGIGPINRMDASTPDDDFRWVINLENNEFPYGNIDGTFGLDLTELKHVVQISSGEFYTRLKSPLLRRSENAGVPADFGALAGVVGLDIRVNSGGAKLIGANPAQPIFTFSSDPNVMYEFSNSPADTVATAPDHFPHYYDIFRNQPQQKFSFSRRPVGGAGAPGPNPALCGKIFLGEFGGSLVNPNPVFEEGETEREHEHSHGASQ